MEFIINIFLSKKCGYIERVRHNSCHIDNRCHNMSSLIDFLVKLC